MELKEIGYIIGAMMLVFIAISFNPIVTGNFTLYLLILNIIGAISVLLVNVLAKKVAAYYYQAKIEFQPWKISRFGYRPHEHFKNPVNAGIFFPLIFTIVSYGYFFWLAILEFEVFATSARATKMHGAHRYTQMTDFHIGMIAAFGVLANFLLAIICYFIGFTEISRLSIYFAAFSLVPLSNLDGTKIFFAGGGLVGQKGFFSTPFLWLLLVLICAILLGFIFVFPY